ncbi:glycosyltransferase family 4 protein [Phenylobacterium sp. 20VBR1]|uniref:Glycosyltransferase family 4 protein n=1 Tax=Phenylobacterium glaciei TaxID=2803784 RepID=A0A941D3G6_9CAUL|nr:glycosyltransferase family 4 protein [Phenylobacterium glaciei]MBR7620128.1 glycosyltransferase family 4 protein [Phenylobacterium glaciei]
MLKTPSPAVGVSETRAPSGLAGAPPLRIAFLSYRSDPRVGGQGVYLSQAAAALARRGHSVDILSGPPYPDVPEGVTLIKLPSLDLYNQPHNGHRALRWRHLLSWTDTAEYFGHWLGKFMEPWTFGRRAAKYLRAHRRDYDVVLDNQSLSSGLLDIERAGLPVVGVIHHPIRRDLELALAAQPEWGMRALTRQWYSFLKMQERVAPRLHEIILPSQAAANDVAACLDVDPAAMNVIHLGIDQDTFKPQPDIRRRDNRILTTASADVPLKGLKHLIEAYCALLERYPRLELVVIGKLREGPTAELLDDLNLLDRVSFIHDLSNDEMAEQYARATICVTPSLYEGFGLPAAEAMSCGAPVVVTDGGSLPEVVGDAGVVVPKGDSAALARAIGALLDDPARRADLGAAARQRARKAFSWDRAAETYEAVLRRAIARKC